MGTPITQRAREAYERFDKIKSKVEKAKKKAEGYIETVKKLLDEDTRSGEIVKQALKYADKLAEKYVGASITKHPYFVSHKPHPEALISVLTASDTHANAMQALHRAVLAADNAEDLTRTLDTLVYRKRALQYAYAVHLADSMATLSDAARDPERMAKELKEIGETIDSMRAGVEINLYAWRADACELYFDGVDLLPMVQVEAQAAAEAMARYDAKQKQLHDSGKSIDRVAYYATIRDRQYEELQRDPAWTHASTSSPQAVRDPVAWAQLQVNNVEKVARVLATVCDVAMSDTVYDPDAVNRSIGSL